MSKENFFKKLDVTNDMKAKLQADVEDQKQISMEKLPEFQDHNKRTALWQRITGFWGFSILFLGVGVTLAILTTIPPAIIAIVVVAAFAYGYYAGIIEPTNKESWRKGYDENIVEEVRHIELDIEKSVAKLTENDGALKEFNEKYVVSLNDEQYYNFVYNSLNLHALAVEEIINNNRYKDLTKEQVHAIAEIAIDDFFKEMSDEQVKQLITDLATSNEVAVKSATKKIFFHYNRICNDITIATEELFTANKTKYLRSDIFQEVVKTAISDSNIGHGEIAEQASKLYQDVKIREKKNISMPNLSHTNSLYSSVSRLDSVVEASNKVRKSHVEKIAEQRDNAAIIGKGG